MSRAVLLSLLPRRFNNYDPLTKNYMVHAALSWKNMILLGWLCRRFDSQEVDYNYVMVINKYVCSSNFYHRILLDVSFIMANIKLLFQRTEKHRICFGKSGIHGWGPFARRNIQEGEMVPSSENYLIICMLCFSWTEMLYLSLYFSFILGNGGHDKKRQVQRFIFSNVFRFFITIKSGV